MSPLPPLTPAQVRHREELDALAWQVAALASRWAIESATAKDPDRVRLILRGRDAVLAAFGQLAAADGCVQSTAHTVPGKGTPEPPPEAL